MSFMKPVITEKMEWVELEATHESAWIPKEDYSPEDWPGFTNMGTRVGHGARLSAPGYLDCTDWIVCDTQGEALGELGMIFCTCVGEDGLCEICEFIKANREE